MKYTNVLLIDDDEDDYVLTKDVFTKMPSNYVLSWVNSFEKGRSAMLNKEYDVYLLDFRLTDHDGIELLSEAINSGCVQPIIMLTGKGSFAVDQQAMELGAADYLVKDNLEASMLERSIRYSVNQTSASHRLQASELKYRIIFEQAIDPIIVMDHTGKILDLNPSGLKFFGYDSEEIREHTSQMLFKHQEDAINFFSLLENKGLLNDFECSMQTKDGRTFYCALSAFIHTDLLNVTEVYHTMIKDLSHRKNVEAQSINSGKMDISENIAKGLGQEMRDPLTTINLALDEIAAEEAISSNESAQACIEIIKSNCDKMDQLVRNLILSTDSKALNVQKHSIRALIDEVMLEGEDLIAGQHIRLTKQIINIDDELIADKQMIKKAINNVFQNALEAIKSYPKHIHITAAVDKGFLIIGVEDNGIGIDPEIEGKIFEPFFTTKIRAVGLGLTHAQRIMTSHHGTIQIKALEKGTQITLQIPLEHKVQAGL